jgi:hypothetical protein
VAAFLAAAAPARAQEWRAVAQVGQVAYEGAPTSVASTSSLVLGLSRTDLAGGLGFSAGIPLADEPFWGVAAASRRFEAGARLGPLLDLSGHAFLQRDLRTFPEPSSTPGPLDPLFPPPPPAERKAPLSGRGAGGEVSAGLFALLAPVRLEARLGVAAQRSLLAEVAERRVLPLADARLALAKGPLSFAAEARGWSADEGDHLYAGGTAQVAAGPLAVWGSAGWWPKGGVGATPWAAGARLAAGELLSFEVSARGHAFDPLYRTETERSVVFATSVRLGGRVRRPPASAPVPAAYDGDRATLRIRAADATGRPAIAGDFTGWKPQPMRREGDHWIFGVRLAPGVYHYAFVSEDGRWFVPESVPGRQDDGMGGHVAVLVVSS